MHLEMDIMASSEMTPSSQKILFQNFKTLFHKLSEQLIVKDIDKV